MNARARKSAAHDRAGCTIALSRELRHLRGARRSCAKNSSFDSRANHRGACNVLDDLVLVLVLPERRIDVIDARNGAERLDVCVCDPLLDGLVSDALVWRVALLHYEAQRQ